MTRPGIRKLRAALLPGLAIGLVAAALAARRGREVESIERLLWDVRAARAARAAPASPRVVLVAVDDATVALAGGTVPIPRSALAAIVSEARRAGARVIAIDFLLEDTLEGSLADENAQLEEAIAGGGVILAASARALPAGAAPDPAPASAGPWAARLGGFDDPRAALAAAIAEGVKGRRTALLPAAGKLELVATGFTSREDAAAVAGAEAVLEPGGELLTAEDARTVLVRRQHARDAGGRERPERFAVNPPLPRFAAAAAGLGVISQQQEDDGKVRALRHVFPTAAGDFVSLPLAAAALAAGGAPVRIDGAGLHLGAVAAPLAPDGRVWVRWTGPHDGRPEFEAVYPQVSAAELLRAALAREGEGTAPAPAALAPLAGAVVVLSPTVTAAKDKRPTPVNPRAVGGEIIATAIDGFLRGAFVSRVPPAADAALALALAALAALAAGAVALLSVRPAIAAALAVAAVGLVGLAYWLLAGALAARGIWIGAAAPLAGMVLAALASDLRLLSLERRDRQFVHDALGRYTSPALVRTLLDRRELLDRFGGARQELTVYFSDIRGFTTLSEGLSPERLVELLNSYLSTQTEIVERHGGYVDKYIGDAIMAVWGAPVPAADHAARACRAALELRANLAAHRAEWRERFGVEIFARAGVNTCEAVAGNIGSARKTQYTVLGDGVNLASRLEGANKAFGTEILVGEGTRRAAGSAFAFRSIDLLRVKGKTAGAPVYVLVAEVAGLPPAERDWLARWEEAIALYRARRFEAAQRALAALRAERPDDAPVALYLERTAELIRTPPPAEWDGIHELHEK